MFCVSHGHPISLKTCKCPGQFILMVPYSGKHDSKCARGAMVEPYTTADGSSTDLLMIESQDDLD